MAWGLRHQKPSRKQVQAPHKGIWHDPLEIRAWRPHCARVCCDRHPGRRPREIQVAIGHQSMCTDTYTGGIVIKELKLLEKHLPKTGKYQDAKYEIAWSDYASGGPITNQMLANKLGFGVMGDYPLIVNGAKFQETNSLRTSTSRAPATT